MRKLAICTLLGLAACGPAIDPYDPSTMVAPQTLVGPPIYSLLGYRADLELTSAQVEALDSIGQEVERANGAAVADLSERAAQSSRNRGMIPVTGDVQPVVDQIREKNRLATLAVQEVLTDEQERQVCRLFEPSRAERERMRTREGVARARAQRGAMGADSLMFGAGRVWPWCGGMMPTDSVGR